MPNLKITNDGILIPTDTSPNFTYSDGRDQESYMLEALKKTQDKSSSSDELMGYIKDWPTRYHFSKARANLLRSLEYLLPIELSVLEVGSGCGAITRYLGERFKSVDAVEGSYERAKITKERVRDLTNVNVICVNLQDIKFDKRYDLICVIGVLEYAGKFWKDADPYSSFLKSLNNLLAEDGYLIIAIENRMGLKYWTGCSEDHTHKMLEGVLGYPSQNKETRTFSKKEITELLNGANFNKLSFLYPFPDYKIPNIILSQNLIKRAEQLNLSNIFVEPFEDFSGERVYFINEFLLTKSIISAALLDEFSNSFLIVASKNKIIENPPFLFNKYNFLRRNCYTTVTSAVEEGGSVVVEKERAFLNLSCLDTEIQQKIGKTPYYNGELVVLSIIREMHLSDPQEVFKKYLSWLKNLLMERFSAGTNDLSGYPLVKGEAVDFTFWNIVNVDGDYIYFDDEWKFKDALPLDYVLFRNFLYFFKIALFTPRGIEPPDKIMLDIMQGLFPQYNDSRLQENIALENAFQRLVCGTEIDIRKQFEIYYHHKCYNLLNVPDILNRLDFLEKELQQKQMLIDHIMHTKSWKITAPLRWLQAKFSGKK